MPYTLNVYSYIWQLYLNKTEKSEFKNSYKNKKG